ncbi:hypothetical protein [Macrococcus equipercicus]|uniref:Uncharacterized protein n=1 Tax=Macrococcus equipercicus TaxID=69967 RepID=A0A9Q9BKG2_9STAP|nr:hypothetical protein [Macrococcus equipercicus]UTH13248.1 hypothetical protein KFV11_08230 [Macrococcus equipercicus]
MPMIAGIDFMTTSLSPFVQVDAAHSMRFSLGRLSSAGFKGLLAALQADGLDMAVVRRAEHSGRVRRFQLFRVLRITNWREVTGADGLRFIIVSHVSAQDMLNYYRMYRRKSSMPICTYFYNDTLFIRISPLYVDVVADDAELITRLKDVFAGDYRTDFDALLPISEGEWG